MAAPANADHRTAGPARLANPAGPARLANPAGPARPARRRSRHPLASVGLHTALLAASAIALFPVAWVLLTSLRPGKDWQHATDIDWGSLSTANYTAVLGHTHFGRWFVNSVVVSAGTTLLGVFIAATAGYALSRMRFPGHRALMWLFLITQMFPVAILIVPLYNIMSRLHLLDQYAGLILAYCTVAVPFCAWLLKGYFDTIPMEIDEAGQLDGLNPFGVFWRLVLPLARPGLAVTGFYTFLTGWGEVAYASQFMTSENKYTLAFGMQTFVGQYKAEWGLMTAAAVLIAVPAAGVFFLAQKHLVTGLTAGGTKG